METCRALTVGSAFAGIGGFDIAFERAGARILWSCEQDFKCRSVLRHHWPGVPRYHDVSTVTGAELRAHNLVPDVLVGGFPCQDVSVAGARAGLDGERSGLFFEFARIAEEARPQWIVVENVPGLLSSQRGRDMGTILGVLADIGYLGAWRVLDAQYFGVAQRRRRVFIVGCLGDGRRAAEVLLEPEGGGGDPPARRAEGEEVAGTLGGGSGSRGWCDDLDRATFLPVLSNATIYRTGGFGEFVEGVGPLRARYGKDGHEGIVAFHMTQDPITSEDVSPAIGGVKPTTGYSTIAVQQELAVRRLTPLECLRLQGFPDDWLDGPKLADSVKYRMVGNAVAVPVVNWIARRIVDAS